MRKAKFKSRYTEVDKPGRRCCVTVVSGRVRPQADPSWLLASSVTRQDAAESQVSSSILGEKHLPCKAVEIK